MLVRQLKRNNEQKLFQHMAVTKSWLVTFKHDTSP